MTVSFLFKHNKNKGLPRVAQDVVDHAEKAYKLNQQVASCIDLLRPLVDTFEKLGHAQMSVKVSEALSKLHDLSHCRVSPESTTVGSANRRYSTSTSIHDISEQDFLSVAEMPALCK